MSYHYSPRSGSSPAGPAGEAERLVVSRQAWDEIVGHCRREAPNEACGVLGGRLVPGGQRATLAVPVVNILADPRRYRMDPRGMMAAFDHIEEAGLEEIAYYHSHPASEPVASKTDIAEARIGTVRMLIVSLQEPAKPRAVFYLLGEGVARPGKFEIE